LANALKVKQDISDLLKQLAAESGPGITWLPGETNDFKKASFKAICIKSGSELEYFIEVVVRWSGGMMDRIVPVSVRFFDKVLKPVVRFHTG
jgi:hypothetical protein